MKVGGGVYGGASDQMTDLIQNSESNKLVASCSSDVDLLDSLWIPRYSSSSSFHATPPTTMLHDTTKLSGGGPASALTVVPILQPSHNDEHYLSTSEKKRRLRVDQVEYLEKNFEVENKLEPERKIQLAKDIGLQPRQVAIWFQNRRARYKTKQLEKDYEHLKSCYDKLVVDYDLLKKEKDKLNDQVIQLTNELKSTKQETIMAKSEPTSPITSIHPSPVYTQQDPQLLINNHLICSTKDNITMVVSCKQEGVSSARSDVFDSESSPRCTTTTTTHHAMGNNNSSHLLDESANSSPLINHEPAKQLLSTAGFSLNEDHQLSNIDLCLLPLPSTYDFSPKNSVEDPGWCYEYDDDLPASANNNSCNLGLPASVDIDH